MDDKSRASGLRLGENTPACPTQEQVTLTDAGTRLQTSSLCCLCSSSLLLLFVSVQDGCALVCVVRFHVVWPGVRLPAALCSALSLLCVSFSVLWRLFGRLSNC